MQIMVSWLKSEAWDSAFWYICLWAEQVDSSPAWTIL